MKIKEVFEKSVQFFREKNIESPRLEAELLLASVLKTDRIGIYLKYEAPLTDEETKVLRELVVRKGKGEPTAYLLQEKYFYGRKFKVGPGVLIPRPETEQIIEEALHFIQQHSFKNRSNFHNGSDEALRLSQRSVSLSGSSQKESSPDKWEEGVSGNEDNFVSTLSNGTSFKIADLGSGSGCLGLTLGLELPMSEVTLIEKSPQAFEFAKNNFSTLVDEAHRSRFHLENKAVEDFTPPHRFHIILANPPYIGEEDSEIASNVKAFEPHEALFAADQGMAVISSWLKFVVDSLEPSGVSYFEIGHKQGDAVKALFQSKNCFQSVDLIQDFNQRDRIIRAVKYG